MSRALRANDSRRRVRRVRPARSVPAAVAVVLTVILSVAGMMPRAAAQDLMQVNQGSAVIVGGSGLCTVGYNDYANRRSFVASHCGAEGARVSIYDRATGRSSGQVGTLYRSKAYNGRLSNDWAAIQWDPAVRMGPNGYSGNGRVHPNDIRLGETVCYSGQTSHPGGGSTCGKFAGSAGNTFFVDAPLTRPGDSGGPLWVPGRGFVGTVSSGWNSVALPLGHAPDFVVGMVPQDGPAVPEMRLLGVYVQNIVLPVGAGGSSVGPVGEAMRVVFGALFSLLSALPIQIPGLVAYG